MKSERENYLDVGRGVAIIMVILVHTSQQFQNLNIYLRYICDYSATGVQLFFTISAISLCISYNKRNEKKVRYFFIRRFFRIAPLYYIAILFYNNFFNINILNYNNSIVGILSNFFLFMVLSLKGGILFLEVGL